MGSVRGHNLASMNKEKVYVKLGLGYELGLSVYSPVMPLPQSSLNPMCTYPDVLLYILSFPLCRVARILKRFVT